MDVSFWPVPRLTSELRWMSIQSSPRCKTRQGKAEKPGFCIFRRIPSSVRCVKYVRFCYFFFKCCLLTVYLVYFHCCFVLSHVKSSFLISHLVRQMSSHPSGPGALGWTKAGMFFESFNVDIYKLYHVQYIYIFQYKTCSFHTHIFGSTWFLLFDWFQVLFSEENLWVESSSDCPAGFLVANFDPARYLFLFQDTQGRFSAVFLSVKRVDSFQNLGETSNQIVFGGPGSPDWPADWPADL